MSNCKSQTQRWAQAEKFRSRFPTFSISDQLRCGLQVWGSGAGFLFRSSSLPCIRRGFARRPCPTELQLYHVHWINSWFLSTPRCFPGVKRPLCFSTYVPYNLAPIQKMITHFLYNGSNVYLSFTFLFHVSLHLSFHALCWKEPNNTTATTKIALWLLLVLDRFLAGTWSVCEMTIWGRTGCFSCFLGLHQWESKVGEPKQNPITLANLGNDSSDWCVDNPKLVQAVDLR